MININQKKDFEKTFVDFPYLLWYVCVAEKVNTNLGDGNYEEKSIMYGNGGDFTANTNGIGGTLANETKSAHLR